MEKRADLLTLTPAICRWMGGPLGHLLIILGIPLLHSGGIHLADCGCGF